MKKLLLATLITAPVLFNYTYAAESHKATDDHAITVESKLSAEQKAVYEVVSRYQDALNAGDVDTILSCIQQKVIHSGIIKLPPRPQKSVASNIPIYLKMKSLLRNLHMTA